MKLKLLSFLNNTMLVLLATAVVANAQVKPRVLVFTKAAGFAHDSRPAGAAAITKMGAENNFSVDTTSDAKKIEESNLKRYAALIFVSTTGDMLNNIQQADLQRYIQAGGGFVGIHAAADAEYDWHWYGRMVGGYFAHHPAQQNATLTVVDKTHISTSMLPTEWKRWDEWYHYKAVAKDLHILINLEESSLKYNDGDKKFAMGASHPIAWYHDFEGGRVFYTGLGHTKQSYTEDFFLQHLLGGIKFAIGKNQPLNYGKVKTQRVPDANRFSKKQLSVGGEFDEPTEMSILPNLDILVAQRKGQVLLYSNATKKTTQVGFIPVYHHVLKAQGVNAEEGLLGIKIDPDFAKNHFVYMFYSPVDTSVNRLSRFTFTNGKINRKSEKVILQLGTTREICCHTGGSIAFGKDHMLYVSQGDNTTPFDEPSGGKKIPNTYSFAPLDDRPGFEQYDDRRGSGNTNDLRGKIMRIKINSDGSYTIPEGNLFPKGTDKTRPEIYVMGNRNPYRISVDSKTGFLYWGEVGPDASNDSLATHGPRGYDEVNQARKAGNFGYPFFVGNNYAYRAYDYATGKVGDAFDPARPVNNSRNNTGLEVLPPAQPAFIWYPYAVSPDFPQVGSGGRNAMAGPVYHAEDYKTAAGRLPDYYNNKLFIYDFVRGWIKAVTMTPEGDYDTMEPFVEGTKFNSMIDMEMGPDGKLYVLEYGNSDGWFKKNTDAGISRIEYNAGNRAPEIASISADKTYGSLPLKVKLSVKATDPEKDKMTYNWNFGNGVKKVTAVPTVAYTYTKKAEYKPTVTVKDAKLASATSKPVYIAAGSAEEPIDPTLPFAAGKALMMSLDCKACHSTDAVSVGPSFTQVANKYPKNKATYTALINKVQGGGTGVWGDVVMPAHPSLKAEEVTQILDWVFSLKTKK